MDTDATVTKNTFEINTQDSRPKALEFFTDFKAKLLAANSDADILLIYNEYLPIFIVFETIITQLQIAEGTKEGKTQSFEELIAELILPTRLGKWEGKVRAEYPEGTSTEHEIFPNKRGPFNKGTYENRVLSVKVLGVKLVEYPVFAALSAEVLSFHNLLQSTREVEQGNEQTVDNLKVIYENQRIIIADQVYGDEGRLRFKFKSNRSMIPTFIEYNILYSTPAKSKPFDGVLAFSETKVATILPAGTKKIILRNPGQTPIQYAVSNDPNFIFTPDNGKIVQPNEEFIKDNSEDGYPPIPIKLYVNNMSNTQTGMYEVEVFA